MIECVKTIRDLKDLDPRDMDLVKNPCIFLLGYYKPGDGGGGQFYWEWDCTESEDQGIIIKSNKIHDSPDPNNPNNRDGRWRRIFEDFVSIKWFGAKGDMKEYAEGEPVNHYKGTISKDTFVLTTPMGPAISEADVGKVIVIWKDATANLPLITKIIGYDKSTKKVTLEKPLSASTIIYGTNVAWGTDDSAAIKRTIEASTKYGLRIYIPPGHFVITETITYKNAEPRRTSPEDTYPLMVRGLQMFGAGSQISAIHNEILDGRPTIEIDGSANETYFSFQQTGLLKDFTITSTGQIQGSSGIYLRATWGYTIQNIHILKMGSDGIVLRNRTSVLEGMPNSDGDASDKVYINNVLAWKNNGWGINVDAPDGGLSTSRIHIERCKIEENKLGGIKWCGQGGTIERSGIYGNGSKLPADKEGYGILVKNVKATSNGLLITGCEIQDNAIIQVMIAVGANIRIIQNDFKADEISPNWSFPSVDIQVGDGNLGDLDIDSFDTKVDIKLDDNYVLKPSEYDHKIIELTGMPLKDIELTFPVLIEGSEWLIRNRTERNIKLIGVWTDGSKTQLPTMLPYSQKSVHVYKKKSKKDGTITEIIVFEESSSRLVSACVIEDNRIRVSGKGEIVPPHTAVKVNRNAVGTIIGKWWADQFKIDDTHKLVEVVEINPLTDKRTSNYLPGQIPLKTHLQRDGIDGGHVLLPFASKRFYLSGPKIKDGKLILDDGLIQYTKINTDPDPTKETFRAEFTPDTTSWSHYYVIISGTTASIALANPTVRTVGTPLFFEFINNRSGQPVIVTFGPDYAAGAGVELFPGEIVSGMMIFDETYHWRLYSSWTYQGFPLPLKPSGKAPQSKIL